MRTAVLVLTVAVLGSWAGCAHSDRTYHQAKADYHHERAARAWETDHPGKAVNEKLKEGEENIKR